MKKMITLIIVFIVLLVANARFVSATEISLEPTKIPEGDFSILLYKPVRSELPLKDESAGFTITTYSYQSYFPAFDVAYTAGFTDWTPSKKFEIKKYGQPLTSISRDLDTSIQGVKVMTEKRLHMDVNLLESSEIKYKTHIGRDAKFEFISSGSHYIIRHRTYMIGYKEYWQQVVYPQQYESYVRPQAFLDSFKLHLVKSTKSNSADNMLREDGSYTWFANIIKPLTKLLKATSSKKSAEQELRQLPNSKPYIKNGQYKGQSIISDNKEFMFIFFGYNGEHISVVNIGFAPAGKEKMLKIYDLIHGSLSKLFIESKKNVFDVGNGYYAFINKYHKSYAVQILKTKESDVK